MTRQPRAITAYIGEFSTWTWTFSTSLSTRLQVSDLANATQSQTTSCVRAGVETRTDTDCAPALLPELAREMEQIDLENAPPIAS